VLPPATAPTAATIVRTAQTLLGTPYREAGTTPKGFDCSGLVWYVFAQNGLSVPRDVRNLFRIGQPVPARAIKPGDLLFFTTTGPGATHVAIATGNNQFIHAPKSRTVVRIESLVSTYWAPRFLGARRVVGS
jgi:peptidoglycan endopeptidase LytE